MTAGDAQPHGMPSGDFSHEIIGAAVEVQRVLGTGLPGAVYAAALAVELAEREIGFARDVAVTAAYKGRPLGEVGRADFVVEQAMVVQVRAVDALDDLIIEDILAMPADELRAEILAEGGDPDAMEAQCRAGLERAILTARAAREAEKYPAGGELPAVWTAW